MIDINGDIAEELERLSSMLSHHRMTKQEHKDLLMGFVSFYIGAVNPNPAPNMPRTTSIEIKTVGQLIDELTILNIRIWMLIDKVKVGIATPEEAQKVQEYNDRRNQYVRAIDRRLGDRDIGAKLYGS